MQWLSAGKALLRGGPAGHHSVPSGGGEDDAGSETFPADALSNIDEGSSDSGSVSSTSSVARCGSKRDVQHCKDGCIN